MNQAIIAAEDRQFYSEGGISVTGILRAADDDIKGGSYIQGGSTLTEQFVKNYYTGLRRPPTTRDKTPTTSSSRSSSRSSSPTSSPSRGS